MHGHRSGLKWIGWILRRIFPLILLMVSGQLFAQSFYLSIQATGTTEICRGDSVEARISVFFGGSPPFTVVINDNDGEYLVLKEIESPHLFWIKPDSDNTYYISSATDSRGRKGRPYGSVEVTVHLPTPVSIVTDRTAFLVSEPDYPLVSSPPGGEFSGAGVSGNLFSPSAATPEGSPHEITCIYKNEYGCVSSDRTDFHVLRGDAGVVLLSGGEVINSFCSDGSSYSIEGTSADNLKGSFELFESGGGEPIPDAIEDTDPDDNMATLLSEGLSGDYEIVFTCAFNELVIEATTPVTAFEPPETDITGLPDTVCNSDAPYALAPIIDPPDPGAQYQFSGPGISGNSNDGYFFDPGGDDVIPGPVLIDLEVTSSDGCQTEAATTVLVGAVPIVRFSPDNVCLGPGGDTVTFTNLTDQTDRITSWSWDFGDPQSGQLNFSDLESPGHFYTETGSYTITLEAVNPEGCRSEYSLDTTFISIPSPLFYPEDICIGAEGGTVSFINTTENKDQINGWEWNFGDPASGENNRSTLEEPTHYYTEPGPRTITLNAVNLEGCVGIFRLDTVLPGNPVVDFSWTDDCFSDELPTELTASLQSEHSLMDTVIWTLRTYAGELLAETGREPGMPDLSYGFPSYGIFGITLTAKNREGCTGERTRELELVPLYRLAAGDYLTGFNEPAAGWKPGSADSLWSWTLGEPDFEGFFSSQGDLAWYTDLPTGEPDYLERSWVRSPCFDLSGTKNPVIKLDLMKSFVPGIDGAVLQYRSGLNGDWTRLGEAGEGENWYNDTAIVHQPGGGAVGWSLEQFEPDTDWVSASYPLDSIGGMDRVKFRIALASGASGEIAAGSFNQGFAFNNFFMGEAVIRRSVLEYFTNASDGVIYRADSLVEDLAIEHSENLFDLHYHMDFPEIDPMNAYNPIPPSTRAFSYGVPGVPYAIFNGGTSPLYRFDLSLPGSEIDQQLVTEAAMEVPLFSLALTVDYLEDRLLGSARITCLTEEYDSNLQLYVVVIEKEVTSYPDLTPDSSFRNVVLDMVPNSAGILLGNGWQTGSVTIKEFNWNYPEYVEDVEDLSVVAFLQDRENGTILQADKLPMTFGVGITPKGPDPSTMVVYPNPAGDHLNILFSQPSGSGGSLTLVHVSGQEVRSDRLTPGESRRQVDVSHLPTGAYLLIWKEAGAVIARSKVILHR